MCFHPPSLIHALEKSHSQKKTQNGVVNVMKHPDAFPAGSSDGVQMAKRQRFVQEHNQQECFLSCTNV
jgi:hypothetical protein